MRDGPRSLIFITQLVDPSDPVLGATLGMIRALGDRLERLTVIGNEVRLVPEGLPASVRVVSLGKERGRSKALRVASYLRALRNERGADALFAHMCPIYEIAASPMTRLLRMPALLWFTHPKDSMTLRVAEWCADAVLTTVPASFPHPGPKVHAIGHAVDTNMFSPAPLPPGPRSQLRLVALGRTSDSKGLGVAIDAVRLARTEGKDVTLRIVGPSTGPREAAHRRSLRASISSAGLDGVVTLEAAVSQGEVPALLAAHDGLLNTTIAGSADKVVFQAMAMARAVLVTNPALAPVLGQDAHRLIAPPGDPRALAQLMAGLLDADLDELGRSLRAEVVARHSVEHWADAVLATAGEIGRSRR